jgi:molybdopterin-guanine dinucleotide biosynthesis protein A
MTGGYDAIVLAGGRSSRLAGQLKPQLSVGDATMLERVLSAVRLAGNRIVVGPVQPVPRGVGIVCEEPPGSGPVAALAAGLPHIVAPVVVLVAADLPFLTSGLIAPLLAALADEAGADAAVLVDESGRDQYLLGAWRVGPLRAALAGLEPLPGRAMREVLGALQVTRVEVPAPTDAPAPWTDVDTPDDLDCARRQSEQS